MNDITVSAEGTIEIPIKEIVRLLQECTDPPYLPDNVESVFGNTRINKDNQTLELDFAYSTDCNPKDWIVKPKCLDN